MSKKNTKDKKENKKPKSKEKDLEVDIVKNDVDDIQKEKEKFLRLFAEFENYKKRTSRERIELFSTASQELMTSLLPVLDDFDRANQEIIKNSDDEIYKGVSLIQNKLFDTLKSKGLKIVEVNKGDLFDADDHEAVEDTHVLEHVVEGFAVDHRHGQG